MTATYKTVDKGPSMTPEELQQEELALYDKSTTAEAYNEGVKAYLAALFLAYSSDLRAAIRGEVLGLGVDNMGELTKKDLYWLIGTLRTKQNRIYAAYTDKLRKELQKYAGEVANGSKELYSLNGAIDADKLWAKIVNTPMQANGVYIDPFLKSFTTSSISDVENALRRAWANNDSVQDTIITIAGKSTPQGTSSIVQAIERRAEAMSETAGHFVFSNSTQIVLASAFGQYRWVSVMDSRTTVICKERNGNVYTFGFGPIPPAHIRCRSHIMPTIGGTVKPENMAQWLSRQPASIRKELEAYAKGKPLEVSKFADKLTKYGAKNG